MTIRNLLSACALLLVFFIPLNAQDPCAHLASNSGGSGVIPDGGWCLYVEAKREAGVEVSAYADCACEQERKYQAEQERKLKEEEKERKANEAKRERLDALYDEMGQLNEQAREKAQQGDYDGAIALKKQIRGKLSSSDAFFSEEAREEQLAFIDQDVAYYKRERDKKEYRIVTPTAGGVTSSANSANSASDNSTQQTESTKSGNTEDQRTESGETFHEEHVRKNNERVAAQEAAQQEERSARKAAEKQAYEQELARIKAEEERRQQETRQNQQRYDQLKQQSYENREEAAELGAYALLVHYLLGRALYGVENNNFNSGYVKGASHSRIAFGYGLRVQTMEASYEILNRNSGKTKREKRILHRPIIELGLDINHWVLKSEGIGIGFNGGITAGHGLLFETYSLEGSAGIKTYLSALAFNAYTRAGVLNHNTWIDETEEAKQKVNYLTSRMELGMRFGEGPSMHNFLFVFQQRQNVSLDNSTTWGMGGRYEGGVSNRLRFYAEYLDLPAAYGAASFQDGEDVKAPFQLSLGVYNSLDYYHRNYRNSYNKQTLWEANKKKTWFLGINAKLSGGNIRHPSDTGQSRMESTHTGVEWQLLFEKNISLGVEGLYANIGAGTTLMRRFDGQFNNEEKPFYLGTRSLSSLSFGSLTLDFPIGLIYSWKPQTPSALSPWVALNNEIVYNALPLLAPSYIGVEEDEYLDEESQELFSAQRKRVYSMLQIGGGLDFFHNTTERLRIGLFYQIAPSSILRNWNYHPHGLIVSVKYTL